MIRTFETPDGIATAGQMIAAMLLESKSAPPGLHLPDALMTAQTIRDRLGLDTRQRDANRPAARD